MISLERRLGWGLALSIIVSMSLLALATATALRHLGRDLVASRLAHDGETLLAALDLSGAELQLIPDRMGTIYDRPLSGHYFVVLQGDTRLRSRSLWDEDLPATPLPVGTTALQLTNGPSNVTLLVWSGGFRKQGQGVTLVLAEEFDLVEERLRQFGFAFAALSVVVLVVLLLAQRFTVRRSLAPLAQTRAELVRLERGEAGQLSEAVPVEIASLVREVNRLVTTNAERLARSRNALGNLAHALKHPLALLSHIERRLAHEGHPLHGELAEGLARLTHLVEGELKRARFAGDSGAGRRFVPAEELPVLAQLMTRIHHQHPLTIDCMAPPGRLFAFDRDDLLELIGNLLDNACKWARTTVRCRVADSDTFQLTVEDDGPGLPPERAQALQQRGARLDESIPGHGLGLAIVKDLVRLYGGELRLEHSPLGGLRVEVVLPGSGH